MLRDIQKMAVRETRLHRDPDKNAQGSGLHSEKFRVLGLQVRIPSLGPCHYSTVTVIDIFFKPTTVTVPLDNLWKFTAYKQLL